MIQPEGEDLRKAVKWVSDMSREKTDLSVVTLVDQASLQFDLGPDDSEFLLRFVKESRDKQDG